MPAKSSTNLETMGGKTTKKVKLRTNCETGVKFGINMIPKFL